MKYLLVLIVFLLSCQTASACSCAEWTSAKDMLSSSAEVVLAIPLEDSVETGGGNPGMELLTTKFAVLRDFKNGKKKEIEFLSIRNNGANCGVHFKKNSGIFLLFADGDDGILEISSCSVGYVSPEDARMISFLKELSSL